MTQHWNHGDQSLSDAVVARMVGRHASTVHNWRSSQRRHDEPLPPWTPGLLDSYRAWLAERAEASPAGMRTRPPIKRPLVAAGDKTSDEAYVVDLCDEVLGELAMRQHKFPWLLGDLSQKTGRRAELPVDAFWPRLGLVVEYRERQHDEAVAHFDKPNRLTASGVHRGLQRRIYDERRELVIPAHGLRLIIIKPDELESDTRGRLRRHRTTDLPRIGEILNRR